MNELTVTFENPQLNVHFQTGIEQTNNYFSGGSSTIDYITAENIMQYLPVTSNGKICDSNNIGHKGKCIGIATETIASAMGSTAWFAGKVKNSAWTWTIGDIIFINGTSLSRTPPDSSTSIFSQVIGRAVASDTIEVSVEQAYQF